MTIVSPKEAVSRWNELPVETRIDAGRGIILGRLQGLRWLPGRRLTLAAVAGNRELVAKLYADTARAHREFVRERDALRRLASLNIAAPSLLGTSEAHGARVLLMEKLSGVTAERLLADADSPERIEIGAGVYRWLRDVARQGCLQTDVHAGNFLLRNGRWHMLDALSCRFSAGPGELGKSLARWLVQFPPCETDDVLTHLAGVGVAPDKRVLSRVDEERRHRWAHMLKKTERDCTAYRRVETVQVAGMTRRDFDVDPILTQHVAGDATGASMLKNGRSASVTEPMEGLVLKRYNIKSPSHALKRSATISRARVSWRAGHLLEWAGIPTARPLAFFEERGLLRNRAWLLMEKIVARPITRTDLEAGALTQVEKMFFLMARFRWSHGDMKASNLLVREGRVYLIDLDAFTRHRTRRRAMRALTRDVRRFAANWVDADFATRVEERLQAAVRAGGRKAT